MADEEFHLNESQNRCLRGPRLTMTAAQLMDVRAAFETLDKHGTGELSVSSVKVALRGLGVEPDDAKMADVLALVDIEPCAAVVSYDQFVRLFDRLLCAEPLSPVQVCRSFSAIGASEDDGHMRFGHLRSAADACGVKLTDEQVVEMIAFASSGHDSCTVEELIAFLSTNTMIGDFGTDAK